MTESSSSSIFLFCETPLSLRVTNGSLEEVSSVLGEQAPLKDNLPLLKNPSFLMIPVRSIRNIFAWVTTKSRLEAFNLLPEELTLPDFNPEKEVLVAESCSCLDQGLLYVEEYCFVPKMEKTLSSLSEFLSKKVLPPATEYEWWRKKLSNDLIIVSDEVFEDLFLAISTQEQAERRGRGGPSDKDTWIMNIPSESLFGLDAGSKITSLKREAIQIGERPDLARGLCRVFLEAEAAFVPKTEAAKAEDVEKSEASEHAEVENEPETSESNGAPVSVGGEPEVAEAASEITAEDGEQSENAAEAERKKDASQESAPAELADATNDSKPEE